MENGKLVIPSNGSLTTNIMNIMCKTFVAVSYKWTEILSSELQWIFAEPK